MDWIVLSSASLVTKGEGELLMVVALIEMVMFSVGPYLMLA